MTWAVKLTKKSVKALKALDNSAKNRIEKFIDKLSSQIIQYIQAKHCKAVLKAYGGIESETIG